MSLIISDFEPSGIPRSVTARPSSLPVSINGVPDTSRLHKAAFGDNLEWYLELPWPSETDPHVIQWIIIRSDGTEYAGHVPEGIPGPLTLDDLIINYGWGIVVPPPLGPIENNLLPTVEGEVTVIQGPTGPAPMYDLLGNRPSATAAGDRTLFIATDVSGGTIFEVQTLLGIPTWVQIGIGALDARLSNSRVPTLHAPTHGSLGSDPVALDAGQITSGTLSLSRLSGLSHSQLDPSAGILGTQIHDVPTTLLTGLLGAAQGGLGLDASGALAREFVLGTGSGAFILGFLVPGDIPGLDTSKITSGTLSLSRLSGITGAQLSGTAGITAGQIASVAASTITGTLSSAQLSLVPGDIPGLDAAKITSGILALARLSGITTNQLSPTAGIVSSQIASVLASTLQGTINSFNLSLVPGDIPGLDASKITSGTLALGRLSGITGGQLSGTAGITSAQIASVSTSTLVGIIGSSHLSLVPGDIPGLDASKITTGVFTTGLIPSLNAAKITSGTLALARGGTGLDSSGATNGQLLIGTGSGFSLATLTAGDNITITNSSGGITIASIISSAVTSVGLAAPSEFSVSGSPVTGAGTLTLTKLNQNANLVYAGPTTGSSGAPVFRYLVAADIPTLPASRITGGQLATARGGTGLDTSSASNGQLLIGTGTGLALAVLTAGTGITITNTSGHIQIDGATTYALPIASASVLGGIKVGSNLAIDGSGVLSGTYSYSLPVASASVLGGVKQGSNVTIDVSGVLSVSAPYSLPIASASVLGGIKVGSGLSIDGSGILSATGGGSGTVTSVGITAPSEITVAGSPVTSSGTIALSWASETQHHVFAAPSGSSGTPGFRALLASDIPALSYVTSVALTVPADFGLSGSPITSSGTLGLTWNAQTGNVVMASPSGGGSGTPTFRSLVSADIPSLDVTKITTGTFATSFIPNLDTAKITSGTLSLARLSGITTTELSATAGIVAGQIASINPSVLTGSGTVPLAALSGITTTQLSPSAGILAAQITSVNPSVLTGSGTVPLAALAGITTTQLSATAGITAGQITSIPNQNASIVTSGTLALARGGTNTDNSSQVQNLVWASPDGSTGTVTYRALVAADIPNLDTSKITTGTLSSARLPTADASNLGAIKVGTTLSIASGVLDYTLPTASASVLGGIKVGSGLSISLGVLSTVNNGTVTSVAMTVPADFDISGSAITSSGTLGLTWNSQTGNAVMASPSGGGSGTPTFRSLVVADIPSLDVAKITTGTFATSFIPNLDAAKITTGTLSSSLLPIATSSALGAIKVGTTLSIASGVLDYTLPTASASVLGGIKIGSGLSIALGVVSTVNNGTVTSVSLTAPAEISVAGSPITGSGTLALTWANETGNVVFSSPSGGGSGTPTFRSLVTADLPNLDASKITTGTLALTRGGTNADNSSQLQNLVWASPDGSTGAVTYRSLVASDIPNLDTSKITTGTLSLVRLSGITTTQLSATAGIVAAQIASVNPSVLTGSGTVPLAGLSGITTTQLSATAGITSGQIASIPNQNASIITTGTLALARGGTNADNSSQLQNLVWASPDGSTGAVTYRALVAADIPNLNASKITAGTLSLARGGTGLDTSSASNGQLLIGTGTGFSLATLTAGSDISITNTSGHIQIDFIGGGVGTGTVTSVALTAPSEISVAGSPITASGTLALTWANETGNSVFSSPSGGSSGTPGFRSLVAADLPATIAYTNVSNVFTQNQTIDGRVIVDIGSSSVEAITVQGTPSNNVRIAFYNNTVGNSKTQFTFGGTLDAHRWAFGNDSSGNNTQNFFLYDAATDNNRLFVDAAGNFVIGGGIGSTAPTAGATLDVRTSSSSTIGAVVVGASGQSVNLQEWQNNGQTPLASISSLGALQLGSSGFNSAYVVDAPTGAGRFNGLGVGQGGTRILHSGDFSRILGFDGAAGTETYLGSSGGIGFRVNGSSTANVTIDSTSKVTARGVSMPDDLLAMAWMEAS